MAMAFGVLLATSKIVAAGEFNLDQFAIRPIEAPQLLPGRPEAAAPLAIAGPARVYIAQPNGTWLMLLMKPRGISFVAGRGPAPFEPLGLEGRPLTSSYTPKSSAD